MHCHAWIGRTFITLVCCAFSPSQLRAETVQSDVKLFGTPLKYHAAGTAENCLAACQGNSDCTGFNFQAEGIADANSNVAATYDCQLMTGKLKSDPTKRITSCRMPCDPDRKNQTNAPPAFAVIGAGDPPAAPPPPAVVPAPSPPPAIAPPPAPQSQSPSATSAAPTRISGYKIVHGTDTTIPPLGVANAFAQCPSGKVAISAGFIMTPLNSDAAFGLEIKGAFPDGADGAFARVTFRNADSLAQASGHAIAVCIDRIVGMRNIDASLSMAPTNCTNSERLIGGGVMAHFSQHLRATSALSDGSHWLSVQTDPIASRSNFTTRSICAPANRTEGVEWLETPNAQLSARAVTPVSLSCPSGKVALAAGFFIEPPLFNPTNPVQIAAKAGDIIAGLVRSLEPTDPSGSQWTMELRNRNLIGGPDSVRGRLQAICAAAQQ